MTAEKKPVSSLKKIGSVALLLLGTGCIYMLCVAAIETFVHSEKQDRYYWFLVFLGVAIGIALIVGGAALWERWRLVLGVIFLADGLWSMIVVRGAMTDATEKTGAEAAMALNYAKAFGLLGVPLLLLGGALIFYEKYRKK